MTKIANRYLLANYPDGSEKEFEVSIHIIAQKTGDISCHIDSNSFLAKNQLKVPGFDKMDMIENAIRLVDFLIFERQHPFEIKWLDGSKYLRSKPIDRDWDIST